MLLKTMLRTLLAAGSLIGVTHADFSGVPTGEYVLDKSHAYVTLGYTHMGFSSPQIGFTDFDATLNLDKAKPEKSTLEVVIQAASVATRVEEFDQHLLGERWFDAEQYPEITFTGTGIALDSPTHGRLTGDLTIKGTTKPVTLDVKLNKAGTHPRAQKPWLGFDAKGSVKRSDWGLGAFAPMVSDDVDITISVEFAKAE